MKLGVFSTVGTTLFFGLRHLPAFYLLCVLIYAPRYLYFSLTGRSLEEAFESGAGWDNDLFGAVEILLMGMVTSVMVWTLVRDRQGESWTVFAALRDAAGRLPMVLGVACCIAVGITLLTVAMDVAGAVAPLAAVIPIVAMVVLALVFAVAMPCAAVDGEGIIECFTQSAQLTSGSRWRIGAVYLLLVVPMIVLAVICFFIFGVDSQMDEPPAAFIFLGGPLFEVFMIAAPVVIYEQLAGLDSGVAFGETAAVFD
jgi:hypothetical protein